MNGRRTLGFVICACLIAAPVAWSGLAGYHNGEIAYVAGNAVVAGDPSGGNVRTLALCQHSRLGCFVPALAWSRQGRRLAFLRGRYGGAGPDNFALFVTDAKGAHLRRVAACGECALGAEPWSPNGAKIALTACAHQTCGLTLFTVKTGASRTIPEPCVSGEPPAWSPDGSKIAFGCGTSLYIAAPTGRGAHPIATVPGDIYVNDLSWSPDSKTLAFDTPDSIFTVDADGSHLSLLRAGQTGNGPSVPSWSPDGTRIVYFTTPGSPNAFYPEVWVMNANGTDNHRVYYSNNLVSDWLAPVWSPDGKQIAFSPGAPSGGLMIMNADGSNLHSIAADAWDLRFAWQPRQ